MASPVGRFIGDALSCHVALEAIAGCGSEDACETCGTACLKAVLPGAPCLKRKETEEYDN
jgi:hypothetical protein